MGFTNYKIIETGHEPQISQSTKSVYDVMVSQMEGDDLFATCLIHGLDAVQVHLAQDYIEQHRSTLKLDPTIIAQKKAARQAALYAIADERARTKSLVHQYQPVHSDNGNNGRSFKPDMLGYTILETDSGPMISHSRISVYDIMRSQQEGADFFALCTIYELRPIQTQIALDYIEKHYDVLASDLAIIIQKQAERRAYYEAIAAERASLPVEMTPKRKAFYALVEKNRQRRGEGNVASCSQ